MRKGDFLFAILMAPLSLQSQDAQRCAKPYDQYEECVCKCYKSYLDIVKKGGPAAAVAKSKMDLCILDCGDKYPEGGTVLNPETGPRPRMMNAPID